ncbi:wiskott-Aldrich syndrome protein homolog [Prionailurus viverrinus]|uniref:wiskott-Aldrich syndrome protein homolog n=1 Tax=Prionailurus viverrinus TaxID=61388 RepID=UPI001FF586F3|nr:wiskott-Aldrich syndrome protein homolog [Prionailurus viverrinus]
MGCGGSHAREDSTEVNQAGAGAQVRREEEGVDAGAEGGRGRGMAQLGPESVSMNCGDSGSAPDRSLRRPDTWEQPRLPHVCILPSSRLCPPLHPVQPRDQPFPALLQPPPRGSSSKTEASPPPLTPGVTCPPPGPFTAASSGRPGAAPTQPCLAPTSLQGACSLKGRLSCSPLKCSELAASVETTSAGKDR